MRKNFALTLLLSAFVLSACSKESPELIPCMCDGSADSTLGLFDCMCEPAKKKPVRRISYLQDKQKVRYQSLIIDEEQYQAYGMLHHRRDTYAPIKLENVDFRMKKNREYDNVNPKLGDYHFRIFGCRRETKNAFLNQGRAMQKDMHFFEVFYETLNDYYPVVVDPSNLYYPDSDKLKNPEYLITAEITDYYMNICDEFDWQQSKSKKLRNGASEMTVVWRIMNLAKDKVYCRGTTTGYGQVMEGEPNGEVLLVERAFEDALSKLPEVTCVNQTLAQRVCKTDIEKQLARLRGYEGCDGTCFKGRYEDELQAIGQLQECQRPNLAEMTPIKVVDIEVDIPCELDGCPLKGADQCQQVIDKCEQSAEMSTECIRVVKECKRIIAASGGTTEKGYTFAGLPEKTCQKIDVKDFTITTEEKISEGDDFYVEIPLEEVVIEEDGGSKATGSVEVDENSFAKINNRFCIVNNPPFEDLKPQNLYRLRASIVSVKNAEGQKGAGLIIADNLVLTSADLIVKDNNVYDLETVNGKKFKASAFRVNPTKNVAALLLDKPTEYQPLPMMLKLPEVNKDILLTIGMLNFDENGENYIDNEGRVVGYRWTEERDAEIIVDTFVQTATLGGALIDQKGNIIGIAHETKKSDTSPDLFIPIETALKALGLEICGQTPTIHKPKAVKYTPIADAIDNSKADKSPKPISPLKRK